MVIHTLKPTKKPLRKLKIGTLLFASLLFFAPHSFSGVGPPSIVYASTSSSGDYSIEFDTIDGENAQPTKPPPITNNQYQSITNSPIKAPQYTIETSNDSFSFALSQTAIDFGPLSATNPVIRTSDMTFSTPARGSKIVASENHPLMTPAKNVLPDTTCDNGSCTQTIPDLWSSNLTYGFGFRCESSFKNSCDQGFSDQNAFKQFADDTAKESSQPIMLNQQSNHNTSGKVIYKVNISGTQALGGYSNTITYIAIPNF
jgi:hypothetical protein